MSQDSSSTCEWKKSFPIIEKESQKFKGKQGDLDGRILVEEREGRHLYIIYYHPKEENQTWEKKAAITQLKQANMHKICDKMAVLKYFY